MKRLILIAILGLFITPLVGCHFHYTRHHRHRDHHVERRQEVVVVRTPRAPRPPKVIIIRHGDRGHHCGSHCHAYRPHCR